MELADDKIHIEELVREIERYLEVVAEFRDAGCDVGGSRRKDGVEDEP